MSLAYLILSAITTRQRLSLCVIIEKRPIWFHCSYFVTSASPKQLKLDIMHLEEIFSLIEVVPPPTPLSPVVLKSVLAPLCLSLRLHAGSQLFLFNVFYEMRFWSDLSHSVAAATEGANYSRQQNQASLYISWKLARKW